MGFLQDWPRRLGLSTDDVDMGFVNVVARQAATLAWNGVWTGWSRVAQRVARLPITDRVRYQILWWLASGPLDSEGRRYVARLAADGDPVALRAVAEALPAARR